MTLEAKVEAEPRPSASLVLLPAFARRTRPGYFIHFLPYASILRREQDGGATGVDLLCTYSSNPTGAPLDREHLYWELSRLLRGVNQLGSFALDRKSLCVNGECGQGRRFHLEGARMHLGSIPTGQDQFRGFSCLLSWATCSHNPSFLCPAKPVPKSLLAKIPTNPTFSPQVIPSELPCRQPPVSPLSPGHPPWAWAALIFPYQLVLGGGSI